MTPLDGALWPADRAPEALYELALAARLAPRALRPGLAEASAHSEELGSRLAAAASEADVELEPVTSPCSRAGELLRGAAPALIAIEGGAGGARLAALLAARGRRAVLVAPDGRRIAVPREELCARWCAPIEAPLGRALEPVLDQAGITGASRARARAALLAEHLGETPVGGAWLVRLPPGRPLLAQARRARLGRTLAAIVCASLGASVAAIAGWVVLGRGVLDGRFEPAWVAAWILCLASTLPLRWVEGWLHADFALRLGALLKRRLLAGAARLDPQHVRGAGSGALLGRVLESDALESLALGGGFLLLGAAIDLALAAWALCHAPFAAAGLALLAMSVAALLVLGRVQLARARSFADARRDLTEDLVERMVGHRTRVAQEPPELWHVEEDRRLAAYAARSRETDRSTLALSVWVSSGFALAGTAALGAAYVAGTSAPTALAIGVGAVLLGQQALAKLSGGLAQLAVCAAAWRQVGPIYRAAAEVEEPGLPRSALGRAPDEPGSARRERPLVSARAVSFRHPSRTEPALQAIDLEIAHGERILVEGPSGGGKSTLASLLVGWRTPSSGTVLLRGLDRRAWGAAGWRARVAAAPQFHENRIFTATLGFNLLCGTSAEEDDAGADERALEVARELGLGGLLERMPSGLRQLCGETGWQLSHGERSRVFLARALLAGGDLVVLDESLAGLDPWTARTVLEALERRAPALVVVAHP